MTGYSDEGSVNDHHVLSISLDDTIAERGTEAYQRQREYASYFSSYSVVTKTATGKGTHIKDGPLQVFPTQSRTKYNFPLDAYRAAIQHANEHRVDVVTTQDPFATGAVGLALKRQLDVPLHVQSHVDFLDNPAWRRETPKNRFSEVVGRFVLQCADAVRVGTEYERRKLQDRLPDSTKISVAPVRIDPSRFDYGENEHRLRQEMGLGDRPVVLFAGRFVEQKGLDTWVETADKVVRRSEVKPHFVLIGDGPEHQRIVNEFAKRGLSDYVHLPGWVPQEDVSRYYDLADVFLITSHYEGTSRVIIEAGLNELPVIATPFAGAKDNIEDGGTGYIATDSRTLAEQVVSLLEHPEHRASMGKAARQHLEQRFDPDRLTEEYVSFLQPA